MYQIGDQVVYGVHGVCRIVALEERLVDRKRLTYFALEPVGQNGSRYLIPTHNEVAMGKLHKMLTSEELSELLQSEQIHCGTWIADENLRKQTYRELISEGNRMALLEMVCTVYRRKDEQIAAGKKVHQCDDNFLRDVEKILAGEISIVMDMEPPVARDYLREQLKK